MLGGTADKTSLRDPPQPRRVIQLTRLLVLSQFLEQPKVHLYRKIGTKVLSLGNVETFRSWLQLKRGKETVGVTAVASTPDQSIGEAVVRLEKLANQLEAKGRGRRRRLQPSRVGAGEGG